MPRIGTELAQGSRKMQCSQDGLTGVITHLVQWQQIEPFYDPYLTGLPDIGDLWPGISQPQLRVVKIDYDEAMTLGYDNSMCMVTVQYSTERNLGNENEYWARWSFSGTHEQIDVGKGGWVWETAGTRLDDGVQVTVQETRCTAELKLRVDQFNRDLIMEVDGCINDRRVFGWPTGCVRCDACDAVPQYNMVGQIISWAVRYEFVGRKIEWNKSWREGTQARDVHGGLLFWQNEDAAADWYTTTATLVGQPVWVSDLPGQSSNPAGTGGWDTPMLGTTRKYESVDFGTLTNIPLWTGDDPIGTP